MKEKIPKKLLFTLTKNQRPNINLIDVGVHTLKLSPTSTETDVDFFNFFIKKYYERLKEDYGSKYSDFYLTFHDNHTIILGVLKKKKVCLKKKKRK